ncbi:MAG: hypothetical protein ACOYOS_07565 [Syntrophales bacterium]
MVATEIGAFYTLLIESREIEKGRLMQKNISSKIGMSAFTHQGKAFFLNHDME